MTGSKNTIQLVWGAALTLMGIAVFFKIPSVVQRLEAAGQFADSMFFVRFCFFLIGGILIIGGVKKIVGYFRSGGDAGAD